MKVYFSGCNRAKLAQIVKEEGGSIMISPPKIAIKTEVIEIIKGHSAIFDSGAFQGMSNPDSYLEIVKSVGHLYEWFPSLDVIGDQEKTDFNYKYLYGKLSSNLRNKLVWVYQGGSFDSLKLYAGQSKLIGIGGLVPMKGKSKMIINYLEPIAKVLKESNCKAHLFGCTSIPVLKWASHQGCFASVDSSRWVCGFSKGEMIDSTGRSYRPIEMGLLFSGEELARQNIRSLRSVCEGVAVYQHELFFDEVA